MSATYGLIDLGDMKKSGRVRPVNKFNVKTLKKWIKDFKTGEVEICLVEHMDGGYALAGKNPEDMSDMWTCVCPIQDIDKERT